MNYKDLLKKYWFVGVIGIALIVFIGIYAVDAYNNRELTVSDKQIDGNYAVYSVDDNYVMADDFFDSLYKTNGLNCEITAFQRKIVENSYETTDEMNENATMLASYNYQQYGKDYIDEAMKASGYSGGVNDFVNYLINVEKTKLLVADYLKANESTLVAPYVEENNPRIIYHILVKVADVTKNEDADGNVTYTANPTEEETAKLNEVLSALEENSFEQVAFTYSEDTGSAQNGGYIGLITNANAAQYDQAFAKESLRLADDEVSEPIVSQYGYHIIWNAGSSIDKLSEDSQFSADMNTISPNYQLKALLEKAEQLNITIVDEELKNYFDSILESGDEQ